jgi:hypothetical protein
LWFALAKKPYYSALNESFCRKAPARSKKMALNKSKSPKTNRLFISWGGDEARDIADWLYLNIFKDNIPALEVFYSEKVPPGTTWRKNLDDNLHSATHGLGILTSAALVRPWFLYEIFVLKTHLAKVPILSFCGEVFDRHPLSELQMGNGMEFDSVCGIARMLLDGQEEVIQRSILSNIEKKKKEWAEKVSEFAKRQRKMSDLQRSIGAVTQTLSDSTVYPILETNACMRELARKTLTDLNIAFHGLTSAVQQEFRLDLSRYPEYLVHLQSSLHCKAKAVAVVNDIEEFWAQQTGQKILEATQKESQRVFVFENANALRHHWDSLQNHSKRYHVAVMAKGRFQIAAKHHKIDGDFSVLTAPDTGDEISAYYDHPTRSIKFTASRGQVNIFRRAFDDVWAWARRFPAFPEDDKKLYESMIESFLQEVFTPIKGALYHSHAIPIHLYDAFEEDHPFYKEMHAWMLEQFRKNASPTDPLSMLEIGAGTGHFTKRLAQQPGEARITALEPDPAARRRLEKKIGSQGQHFGCPGKKRLGHV